MILTAYGQPSVLLELAEVVDAEDAENAETFLVPDRMTSHAVTQPQIFFISNNFSTTTEDEDLLDISAKSGHHPAYLVLILLNIWTTVSNALVLFVMFRTPQLRRRFGCVMFSLSLADFCCSLIVMPLAIYYFSNRSGWQLGSYTCVWWITADVFFCTASICHHASIAIHRYLAIAKPHQMSMITTNTPIILQLILPSWTIGFAIAIILAIQAIARHDIVFRNDTCGLQDRLYLVYSSVVSFFIPLSVIILVSLKSILLLRHHLRLKQQAILKNLPRPRLESVNRSLTASVDVIPNSSPASLAAAERPSSTSLMAMNAPTIVVSHAFKSPPVHPPLQRQLASPLRSAKTFYDDEKLRKLAEDIAFNASKGRKSRAMSLTPTMDKKMLSHLKASAAARIQNEQLLKMTSFRTLINSYLELGSYAYSTAGVGINRKSGISDATSKSGMSSHNVLSRTSSLESDSVMEDSRDSPDQSSVFNKTPPGGSLLRPLSGNIGLKNKASTASQIMEAIKEEEHNQLFSPASINGSSSSYKKGGSHGLRRKDSIISFGSDVFIGDDQSLNVDLTQPFRDFESAIISVDEMTPSIDMMTSYGYAIPDIPPPIEEEQPLDLRVVFSRTVPNFQQASSLFQKEAVSKPIGLEGASKPIAKKFRKRAYTISLPICHLQVQHAPLAKMEVYVSPQPQRRRVSGAPMSARLARKRNSLVPISPNPAVISLKELRRYSQGVLPPLASAESISSSLGESLASNVRFDFKTPSPAFRRQLFADDASLTPNSRPISRGAVDITSSDEHLEVDIDLAVVENRSCNSRSSGSARSQSMLVSPRKQAPPAINIITSPIPPVNEFSLKLPKTSSFSKKLSVDSLEPDYSVVSAEPFTAPNFEGSSEDVYTDRLGKVAIMLRHSPKLVRKSLSFRSQGSSDNTPRTSIIKSPKDELPPAPLPSPAPEEAEKKHRKQRHTVSAKQRQREKEKQAERVLLFVLFFFVCLWLPFFTTNFLYGICPSCVYEEVFVAFTWCGWCTGAINPIVYTFFNRDFKRAFVRIFFRRCRRNKHKYYINDNPNVGGTAAYNYRASAPAEAGTINSSNNYPYRQYSHQLPALHETNENSVMSLG